MTRKGRSGVSSDVQLKPIEGAETIELVAGWLADKSNCQWLDFGDSGRVVTPAALKIMTQRDGHVLRLFTSDQEDRPIGVVGLSNINRHFKTATLWVVLGDKSYARQGYATRACSKMLSYAFRELGLHAVNSWVVESNPSIHIVKHLNFRFMGLQRQCHSIDGQLRDRFWFDLLDCEHQGDLI